MSRVRFGLCSLIAIFLGLRSFDDVAAFARVQLSSWPFAFHPDDNAQDAAQVHLKQPISSDSHSPQQHQNINNKPEITSQKKNANTPPPGQTRLTPSHSSPSHNTPTSPPPKTQEYTSPARPSTPSTAVSPVVRLRLGRRVACAFRRHRWMGLMKRWTSRWVGRRRRRRGRRWM